MCEDQTLTLAFLPGFITMKSPHLRGICLGTFFPIIGKSKSSFVNDCSLLRLLGQDFGGAVILRCGIHWVFETDQNLNLCKGFRFF